MVAVEGVSTVAAWSHELAHFPLSSCMTNSPPEPTPYASVRRGVVGWRRFAFRQVLYEGLS